MEIQLTKANLDEIQNTLKESETQFLKKIKEQKFSVGDVLIRAHPKEDDDGNLSFENLEIDRYNNSVSPIRHLVVYADQDTGQYFYKAYTIFGTLEDEIYKGIDFDGVDYESYNFMMIDPDFVDATILGAPFNVSEAIANANESRVALIAMNRQNCTHIKTLKQANNFIKSLGTGVQVWIHTHSDEGFDDNDFDNWSLHHKPRKINMETFKKRRRYGLTFGHRTAKDRKKIMNDNYVLYFRAGYELVTTANLIGTAIYTNKPVIVEEHGN